MAVHEAIINDQAIEAELNDLAGGVQSDTAPGAQPPGLAGDLIPAEPQLPREYIMAGEMIIGMFANRVAPNWPIEHECKEDWAQAFAECMNQIMPGGIGNIDNWPAWGKLAFASGMVAMAGVDMNTLAIRPMHEPEPEAEPTGTSKKQSAEFSSGGQASGGQFGTAGA